MKSGKLNTGFAYYFFVYIVLQFSFNPFPSAHTYNLCFLILLYFFVLILSLLEPVSSLKELAKGERIKVIQE